MADVALITGGAVRIGRAIALHLASRRFCVAIQYHKSKPDADDTVAAITAAGGKAVAFQAELESLADVAQLIHRSAALGPVTCLVNNASAFADDSLTALTPESWRRHMAVNLEAPIFLAQAFAAQLPAGMAGAIINILDQRVLRPNPQFFSYTVSKAALHAATKTMAQALAPRIRVNAVAPGPTLKSIHQSEDEFAREEAAMPLGRGARPDEIARAVGFILDQPSITGQTIAVDGGQHLMWQTLDIRVT
ncbi:short-chain dehydrogenase [Rhodomicrobium udaipurense JA643]|uniref:SDR family oxidoreductase n=1 Tax=Rhodomicrobium udaipurense TaxID=1202716 RepID=A0A8I1GB92_9HYPH|nr:SDR family oxidoreductase [Rhodomicrobium udaipurense]KAI95130.1 short-chain dehydrogenase [Rhodomicrobium udaipurense JA643]MBJ7543903.1 SDR family oxidoreductase [Rhodomicrobium udaipurense]